MFAVGRQVQILNFDCEDDPEEYVDAGYQLGDICPIIDFYDNEGDEDDNNVRILNPRNTESMSFWFKESMLKLIPTTAIRRP